MSPSVIVQKLGSYCNVLGNDGMNYEGQIKRVGSHFLPADPKPAVEDAFVVTAYLTDQLKAGETIWPKK